jgi:cytochrome P450
LSYELARTVLRDTRFTTARGRGLDMQGITSGPLWDRATQNILGLDGEQYHRLRRLVSKAFAPRAAERLRTQIVDAITELVDPLTTAGHCDVLANTASAKRDPAVYDNPDRLYITR